jgi:hypothetical protein
MSLSKAPVRATALLTGQRMMEPGFAATAPPVLSCLIEYVLVGILCAVGLCRDHLL